jgi:hypothetical protein
LQELGAVAGRAGSSGRKGGTRIGGPGEDGQ